MCGWYDPDTGTPGAAGIVTVGDSALRMKSGKSVEWKTAPIKYALELGAG